MAQQKPSTHLSLFDVKLDAIEQKRENVSILRKVRSSPRSSAPVSRSDSPALDEKAESASANELRPRCSAGRSKASINKTSTEEPTVKKVSPLSQLMAEMKQEIKEKDKSQKKGGRGQRIKKPTNKQEKREHKTGDSAKDSEDALKIGDKSDEEMSTNDDIVQNGQDQSNTTDGVTLEAEKCESKSNSVHELVAEEMVDKVINNSTSESVVRLIKLKELQPLENTEFAPLVEPGQSGNTEVTMDEIISVSNSIGGAMQTKSKELQSSKAETSLIPEIVVTDADAGNATPRKLRSSRQSSRSQSPRCDRSQAVETKPRRSTGRSKSKESKDTSDQQAIETQPLPPDQVLTKIERGSDQIESPRLPKIVKEHSSRSASEEDPIAQNHSAEAKGPKAKKKQRNGGSTPRKSPRVLSSDTENYSTATEIMEEESTDATHLSAQSGQSSNFDTEIKERSEIRRSPRQSSRITKTSVVSPDKLECDLSGSTTEVEAYGTMSSTEQDTDNTALDNRCAVNATLGPIEGTDLRKSPRGNVEGKKPSKKITTADVEIPPEVRCEVPDEKSNRPKRNIENNSDVESEISPNIKHNSVPSVDNDNIVKDTAASEVVTDSAEELPVSGRSSKKPSKKSATKNTTQSVPTTVHDNIVKDTATGEVVTDSAEELPVSGRSSKKPSKKSATKNTSQSVPTTEHDNIVKDTASGEVVTDSAEELPVSGRSSKKPSKKSATKNTTQSVPTTEHDNIVKDTATGEVVTDSAEELPVSGRSSKKPSKKSATKNTSQSVPTTEHDNIVKDTATGEVLTDSAEELPVSGRSSKKPSKKSATKNTTQSVPTTEHNNIVKDTATGEVLTDSAEELPVSGRSFKKPSKKSATKNTTQSVPTTVHDNIVKDTATSEVVTDSAEELPVSGRSSKNPSKKSAAKNTTHSVPSTEHNNVVKDTAASEVVTDTAEELSVSGRSGKKSSRKSATKDTTYFVPSTEHDNIKDTATSEVAHNSAQELPVAGRSGKKSSKKPATKNNTHSVPSTEHENIVQNTAASDVVNDTSEELSVAGRLGTKSSKKSAAKNTTRSKKNAAVEDAVLENSDSQGKGSSPTLEVVDKAQKRASTSRQTRGGKERRVTFDIEVNKASEYDVEVNNIEQEDRQQKSIFLQKDTSVKESADQQLEDAQRIIQRALENLKAKILQEPAAKECTGTTVATSITSKPSLPNEEMTSISGNMETSTSETMEICLEGLLQEDEPRHASNNSEGRAIKRKNAHDKKGSTDKKAKTDVHDTEPGLRDASEATDKPNKSASKSKTGTSKSKKASSKSPASATVVSEEMDSSEIQNQDEVPNGSRKTGAKKSTKKTAKTISDQIVSNNVESTEIVQPDNLSPAKTQKGSRKPSSKSKKPAAEISLTMDSDKSLAVPPTDDQNSVKASKGSRKKGTKSTKKASAEISDTIVPNGKESSELPLTDEKNVAKSSHGKTIAEVSDPMVSHEMPNEMESSDLPPPTAAEEPVAKTSVSKHAEDMVSITTPVQACASGVQPSRFQTRCQLAAANTVCLGGEAKGNMYVGAHVSIVGGLHMAVERAVALGARSFAMFLKPQRTWTQKDVSDKNVKAFQDALQTSGYSPYHVVPHGGYLINLASPNADTQRRSVELFSQELQLCDKLGLPIYVFHPGSSCGEFSKEVAIRRIAEGINKGLEATKNVVAVIENMAGQGHTVGASFQDLRDIISQVTDQSRVGVCLDTCHAFAAGYDLSTRAGYETTMQVFEDVVGFKYLAALHLNDSQCSLGGCLDRHADIGQGQIGTAAFGYLMNDPRLAHLPMVLETPGGNYDQEIGVMYSLVEKRA